MKVKSIKKNLLWGVTRATGNCWDAMRKTETAAVNAARRLLKKDGVARIVYKWDEKASQYLLAHLVQS